MKDCRAWSKRELFTVNSLQEINSEAQIVTQAMLLWLAIPSYQNAPVP
jgi:hypothetical protein